jgi:hypothetical protein
MGNKQMPKWRRRLQNWKFAYISSIHKKVSKNDCVNYRDISVTCVMCGIYGEILRDLIEEENKMKKTKVDFEQDDHHFARNNLLKKGIQQTKKPIYYFCI